jgi:hypothetical protein
MPLNAEDVQSWDLPKLDKAIDEIRDNVASLREKNGGTLVGMKGADADTVRDAMQDLNLLGEARDGRREQEGNEQQFARLSEYMNEPDPERAVAHGKNGKRRLKVRGHRRHVHPVGRLESVPDRRTAERPGTGADVKRCSAGTSRGSARSR